MADAKRRKNEEIDLWLFLRKSLIPYMDTLKMLVPNGNKIAYIIMGVFFIYVIINFITSFLHITGGMAEIVDGNYVLNNHGDITEITKETYSKQKFYELRLFSGLWIIAQ